MIQSKEKRIKGFFSYKKNVHTNIVNELLSSFRRVDNFPGFITFVTYQSLQRVKSHFKIKRLAYETGESNVSIDHHKAQLNKIP